MVNQSLEQRNAQIRARVIALMKEKSPQGRQKYTSGYIFDRVAEEFELKPRTVKNIFWSTGAYGNPPVSPAQNVVAPT